MDYFVLMISIVYAILSILVGYLFFRLGRYTPILKTGYTNYKRRRKTLVYVWNDGKAALKKEDIVSPICFYYEKNAMISKPKIIIQTNTRNGSSIAKIKKYDGKSFH